MSAAAGPSSTSSKKSKEKEQQEIVANFQKLREEQRLIISKAAELQIEQKSHELVVLNFNYILLFNYQ
jgi:hypothetical protein